MKLALLILAGLIAVPLCLWFWGMVAQVFGAGRDDEGEAFLKFDRDRRDTDEQ